MKRGTFVGLLSLTLAGCPAPPKTPTPAPPAPVPAELDGLRASTPAMRRDPLAVSMLDVTYALEWVAGPKGYVTASGDIHIANAWFLQTNEPVVVRFWDAAGRSVGEVGQRIDLPAKFIDGSLPAFETHLTVEAKADSASLSIALGRSGLETRRMMLP